MALPKCERVYFASIGISIAWGVIQAILSRSNWALLLIGVMSVFLAYMASGESYGAILLDAQRHGLPGTFFQP